MNDATNAEPTKGGKRYFDRVEILVLIALALLVCVLCCGVPAPVEVPWYLASGWATHSSRLANELAIDWPAVGIALVQLVILTLGIHVFCRWLNTSIRPWQKWSWRWSLGITGLLLLAFTAGISAIGLTHQTTWLMFSDEPIIARGMRR